jgi:hypothetical protein
VCDFTLHLVTIFFLSSGLKKFFLDAADDGDGDAAEGDGDGVAAEGNGDQDADALAGER